jgi:hypothetical protein
MRDVLPEYKNFDAVEGYAPYVDEFALRKKYRQVFVTNVMQFKHFSGYDLVIFKDVLEHLSVADAQTVLKRAIDAKCNIIVAVPYLLEQGVVEDYPDNTLEIHLQPDLTPELVTERYPDLQRKFYGEGYGVYTTGARFASRIQPTGSLELERLRGYSVYVGTPTHGQSVSTAYTTSALRTVESFNKLGLKINFLIFDGAAVDKARNLIVAQFMSDPAATHLLWMDADQAWRPNDIIRLLHHNKDVVGIAVRRKKLAVEFNVNFFGTEAEIQNGCIEVLDLGTGCMLMKRSVLQKMMDSYPELKIDSLDEQVQAPEYAYALFQFTVDNNKYYGEDFTFCRRWRSTGGSIWVDPAGLIGHVGNYTYQGSLESTFEEAPDAGQDTGTR